ncbi:hypothetical protein L0F63_004667 [Massospora cicadina]|nr:hypothetical protein L0F63_004667 [Massospora cicadina]
MGASPTHQRLKPGTLFETPSADPLDALIQDQLPSAFLAASKVPVTDAEAVDGRWEDTAVGYMVTFKGVAAKLRKHQRSWRRLATFAKQQLFLADAHDVEGLFKLWCYRLIALINIGLCQLALAELDKLGDLFRPEFHHGRFHARSRGGRVLWARLPAYLGDKALSIDRLYFLMGRCSQFQASVVDPDKVPLWKDRIKQLSILIVNHLISLEDYGLATEVMDGIVEMTEADPALHHISVRLHIHVSFSIASQLKLGVQGGNLPRARDAYQSLVNSLNGQTRPIYEPVLRIDESLLHMAEGNWKMAQEVMEKHLEDYPNDNLVIATAGYGLTSQASNNLAVCSLYLCELPKAIETLQRVTASARGPRFFDESPPSLLKVVILNLATLYELATQRHLHRKRALLEQLHAHLGDGFELSAFKLPWQSSA